MTIAAKIISDSISLQGIRLTTFQLRYPRFIHSEFMTHRDFSRNASSSRAIPVERLIADIERDLVYPSHWGSNKPGMQAGEECFNLVDVYESELEYDHNGHGQYSYIVSAKHKERREEAWDRARENAIISARSFADAGYHKQIVNRLLEPFSHINVVCTATNYNNFYSLRRHKDAQPEIKILADVMWEAQENNKPRIIYPGEWHLPYITDEESDDSSLTQETLIKISVARCARVSYLTHDGRVPDSSADIALYEKLAVSTPLHASPCEHQATPDTLFGTPEGLADGDGHWCKPSQHGNFRGWIQLRKTLENEYVN